MEDKTGVEDQCGNKQGHYQRFEGRAICRRFQRFFYPDRNVNAHPGDENRKDELDFSNRFLKYANEAVLPFYVLHQTVIVVIGYFIKDWGWAVFPKYVFLVTMSFVVIMALYEFALKRVRFLRYVFGMKG
jgi:hypothetical protein